MTLGRQLASAISAIFLFALIGVEAIHLRSAQEHLRRQVESVAQDAATALGLSLGSVMSKQDASLAETVINPVFDRGHFAQIDFVSSSGQILVSKVLPAASGNYPGWFAALFPIEPPTAESLVSSGWRQLGRVRVTAHPRFAYEQLWETARATMIYLILIYVLAMVALRFYLRSLLRPLAAVEGAAQQIAERNFVTLDMRPSTRELSSVVDAINILSRKVNIAIEGETRRAEQMQAAAYRDDVTGLLNARGFAVRFESTYEGEQHLFSGTLALLELVDLAAINKDIGPVRCDELLRSITGPIRDQAFALGGFAGRWTGAEIAMALPNLAGREALERIAAFRAGAGYVLREFGLQRYDGIYAGAAEVRREPGGLKAFAALAEEALRRAREAPEGLIVMPAGGPMAAVVVGEADLASTVTEALAVRRLQLVGQPVFRTSDQGKLHTEIFARLRDAAGNEIAAAQFMPIIASHGLGEELDRAVVERVMEVLDRRYEQVSVNLSIRSLEQPRFVEWIGKKLRDAPALARRLAFEIAEHGVVRNEAVARTFAEIVKRAGAEFAVDHFGAHRESLALFHRLRPGYIKLAGAHTASLLSDAGARFFAESLVNAAHQLDVPVILQNVEDEATLDSVRALGFDGYQGILAGRPVPWPPA